MTLHEQAQGGQALDEQARRQPGGRAREKVARAAMVIAVLTVASRLAGFLRVLVFNWGVGVTDLGDAYQAANTVPNIIFEIVAGGALAGLVVPLLAGPAADGDRRRVAAITSALLTWTVGVLVPVAVAVAVLADPLVRLLLKDPGSASVAVGTDMLRIFAPQLPLYGAGIVLTGVLQTYRRFAWPVIAPLLSSLAAIATYVVFAVVERPGVRADQVGRPGVLVLSIGTTLAVGVLSLCLLIPLRRLGLPLRPRLRMPAAAAAAVRRLAAAGVVTLAAQQLSLGLAIALAGRGPDGTVVIYALAQTLFLLPWAVLAVPVATSAYPGLAEAAAARDDARYSSALAPAARSVLLLCGFGTAALVALAGPAAVPLAEISTGDPRPATITAAVAGFAPGLVGYGLFALLSRALYARGSNRLAAAVTAAGWAAVAAASFGLAGAMPAGRRVAALAIGSSIGLTLLGAAMVVAVARRAGRRSLAGLPRACAATLLATVVAAAAGLAVIAALGGAAEVPFAADVPFVANAVGLTGHEATPTVGSALGQGMLSGLVVAVVYVTVVVATDRRDTGPALAAVVRRLRRRR